jgi:hypothetical protein
MFIVQRTLAPFAASLYTVRFSESFDASLLLRFSEFLNAHLYNEEHIFALNGVALKRCDKNI